MTDWQTWFQKSVSESGDSLEASHYDSARSFLIRQRLVLDWLGDVRGKTILDVGPGAGHFCAPLTAHNTVIGVDFVPDMLKFSANKGLLPAQADGMQLPFASQSLDVVICVGVLQHIERSSDFLKELLRVRKSDGQLYLVTLNRDSLVRWLYYRLTPNKEIMLTYTMPDLLARFRELAPGASVEAAAIYYPLPGYRRVGTNPGISRYLSTALGIRVG
jgi:ubiquinone/menaquinone biosynthesis C-methylase UbiE